MPVTVNEVQVVLFIVTDPEKSEHFYGKVLGLEKVFQDRDRLIYAIGHTRLMLHPVHSEFRSSDNRRGWGVALYLEVDDVDSAIRELRAVVPIHEEPEDKSWGERVGAILDPDGYHIYLTHSLEGTWKRRSSA